MLCWFIIFLLTAGYSSILYFFAISNLWFLFLWIPLGFILGLLTFAIYVLGLIYIGQFTNPKSKLKHHLIYNVVCFVHTIIKIDIKVLGKQNIPSNTYVIYSNHKSMLDVTILYQAYHDVLSAVAKKSLGTVPVLRTLIKSLDVTTIDRDNDREGVRNLKSAIEKVKGGLNYLIFPEGGIKTRDTEELVNLRAGAYKLATKPMATISPVSIIGSSHLSKNCPKKWTHVKVLIHKPIKYEDYQGMTTTELGNFVGEIINKGLETGKILDWHDFIKKDEINNE